MCVIISHGDVVGSQAAKVSKPVRMIVSDYIVYHNQEL